jgi:hypothetical protein
LNNSSHPPVSITTPRAVRKHVLIADNKIFVSAAIAFKDYLALQFSTLGLQTTGVKWDLRWL